MTKNITDMTLGYNKIRYRRIHLSPEGDSPLRPLMAIYAAPSTILPPTSLLTGTGTWYAVMASSLEG